MVLADSVEIIFINKESAPVKTEIINRFGNNVIAPAFSVMFVEKFDVDGFPIYEFVKIEYADIVTTEEGKTALVSTERFDYVLKEKKAKPEPSDQQRYVLHCVQFYRNRKTGELYGFDEEEIRGKLSLWGTVEFGEGVHDRDPYTKEDEDNEIKRLQQEYNKIADHLEYGLEEYIQRNQWVFAGNQKPPHIHVVLAGKRKENGKRRPIRFSTIKNKFGFPFSCIKVIYDNCKNGGDDGFLDALQYLTHEKTEEGKFVYPDSIIYTNVDLQAALTERKEIFEKFGRTHVSEKEQLRYAVMHEGLSIKELREEQKLAYMEDFEKLQKCRRDYLKNRPMPTTKLNIYVGGYDGGTGKGLMGRCVAKNIVDPADEFEDDEIFFFVTQEGRFNGYEGQPVLVWEDFRPLDLLDFFNGDRGEIFKLLEPHPTQGHGKVNVKYDTAKLINCINIFDCIMEPEEWLDAIAGEYYKKNGEFVASEISKKNQIYRRIPISFWIVEKGYTIKISKGVLEGTREYTQLVESNLIQGNFAELAEMLHSHTSPQYKRISTKIAAPAVREVQRVKNIIDVPKTEYTDEELDEIYANAGQPVIDVYPTSEEILEVDIEGWAERDFAIQKQAFERLELLKDVLLTIFPESPGNRKAYFEKTYPEFEDVLPLYDFMNIQEFKEYTTAEGIRQNKDMWYNWLKLHGNLNKSYEENAAAFVKDLPHYKDGVNETDFGEWTLEVESKEFE